MPCPFCHPDRPVLQENDHARAIEDGYPVSRGHALILPKRHVKSYFELDQEEQAACWQLVNELREQLTAQYQPAGLNIGINDGQAAGQTIFHAHIHLILRYEGDVKDPTGGVRGVVPGKKKY